MLKKNNFIIIIPIKLSLILCLHNKLNTTVWGLSCAAKARWHDPACVLMDKVSSLSEQGVRVQTPFEKSLWPVQFPGH